jgi:hypothetical protein
VKRYLAGLTVLMAVAAGASSCTGTQAEPAEPQPVGVSTDTEGFSERDILLSDGRTVTCIVWDMGSGMSKNARGSIDCDWASAEGSQ